MKILISVYDEAFLPDFVNHYKWQRPNNFQLRTVPPSKDDTSADKGMLRITIEVNKSVADLLTQGTLSIPVLTTVESERTQSEKPTADEIIEESPKDYQPPSERQEVLEAKNILSEQSTTDEIMEEAPRDYRLTLGQDEMVEAKEAVLNQIKAELAKSKGDISRIYNLFLKTKQDTQSVLRFHRKNWFYTYGDTQSYLNAIQMMVETAHIEDAKTFAEFNMLKSIWEEADRCELLTSFDLIGTAKVQAKACLFKQIEEQTSLSGVLALYDEVIVPTNILRFERENILYAHGNTDSYKAALLKLANKISTFNSCTEQEQAKLDQLKQELNKRKPYFHNMEWNQAIQALNALREKAGEPSLLVPNTTPSVIKP